MEPSIVIGRMYRLQAGSRTNDRLDPYYEGRICRVKRHFGDASRTYRVDVYDVPPSRSPLLAYSDELLPISKNYGVEDDE